MKAAAFNECTGEKIYELELKERGIGHIADVSRSVRPGECRAYMGDIPAQRGRDNGNDEFFAGAGAGIAAAHSGCRPFDIGDCVIYRGNGKCQLGRVASFGVSCPDRTPERCRAFCPQFGDQEAR